MHGTCMAGMNLALSCMEMHGTSTRKCWCVASAVGGCWNLVSSLWILHCWKHLLNHSLICEWVLCLYFSCYRLARRVFRGILLRSPLFVHRGEDRCPVHPVGRELQMWAGGSLQLPPDIPVSKHPYPKLIHRPRWIQVDVHEKKTILFSTF